MTKSPSNEPDPLEEESGLEPVRVVHPGLERVGVLLRRAREEQGWDLDEMARRTRIRVTHLHALEEGRIDTLRGQVFVAGFLRLYARNLGFADMEAIEACVADLDNGKQVLQTENRVPPPTSRHRPALGLAVAGLVALGGLYVYYERHMQESAEASGPPAPLNAAPLRVGEAVPTRSEAAGSGERGDQVAPRPKEEPVAVKALGPEDPSSWPATDSSPERLALMASSAVKSKPEGRADARPEPKPVARGEARSEPKPEVKPEPKPEVKPEP
ncbi:MAG: helix-turn-helix domain-containing protein, partial [Magnetococcales bacterium]|nr:helix-turn-helix domain-containing protein [Magnetococcales bacterium]